ncbi:MAG: phosphodiesterase [Bacillota bacterium]|jgi:putative phosphoesterase|nr:phosphodiesterase [Bacillota bacterium]NLL88472.1 phosphodiesterase [Bacillota bacterium]HKM17359.1 phosphodiesterase [Limnochordia bacterium]
MKIGVISDTHGSLTLWQKALQGPLRDVDLLLHAGDVLYHGPRNPLPAGYDPEMLAEAINGCPVPLLIVKGNCDSEVDQMLLDIPLQAPFLITDQPLGRILVTHGHYYSRDQAVELGRRFQIDIWISGHTHIPVLDRHEGIVFLNPGSCALPKGEQPAAGVAVITADKINLVELGTGNVYQSLSR